MRKLVTMFGVSLPELIIIFTVILIVFGPDKLPSAARALGKFMGELKKGSDAVRKEFYNSVYTPAQEMKSQIDFAARDLQGVKADLSKELASGSTLGTPSEELKSCQTNNNDESSGREEPKKS